MDNIIEYFISWGLSEFEINSLLKIFLSSICGGLIGLEREIKGRPAGLKTFSLVCLGATLIMITNDYICHYTNHESGDLARMPAQVVSGIGFLGAGSIMVTGNNQVRGLTTAAALWVTAALGIAIGCGFYFGGIAGLLIIYVTSTAYCICDKKIMEKSRNMTICIEGESEEFMLNLFSFFDKYNIKVKSLQRKSENKWYATDVCAIIEIQFTKRILHKVVIEEIKQIKGSRYVDEF
ncbi:MgtC/SapB family protein [Enterocloster citroniae]|uniref:MgtC/SapB/SrpB/YhiD N-terminal domain-containing protein n=1 Tax=[Clostridium] citroniae WAL-17108 TaxID=742733 RepID=G5HQL2_9FIRM|nr:MgtC/SapB family protein [Enterocloster citroniae]EHE96338.1 hypothetical protein HMPREF9469_04874 [ [[Clostridium] citroniae WAL-17108]MCC3387128.1 MgtC/SapB family protein [Enterocloster citroniae]